MNKIVREEGIDSLSYQASKAAVEWYQTHQNANIIEAFKAGYMKAREGQTDLHKDFDVAVYTQSSGFVNPTTQDICKDCINTKGCVTCKDGNMKETAESISWEDTKKDNTKSKEVLRKLQYYLDNATSEELEETWERLKKYNTGPIAISWKEMSEEDKADFLWLLTH